ncbi:MAG: hypothetical protein AAGA57_11220 [Planctomycetota bacterium]
MKTKVLLLILSAFTATAAAARYQPPAFGVWDHAYGVPTPHHGADLRHAQSPTDFLDRVTCHAVRVFVPQAQIVRPGRFHGWPFADDASREA